jgi:hypothetical protein
MKTERIGLATGVTCPSVRYHSAIIAQAAATLAIISDGRFTLGVGAGERLNEHVTGEGFPARRVRHERFREALEIIRLLWQGGYRSYDGRHLKLEDAGWPARPRPCPRRTPPARPARPPSPAQPGPGPGRAWCALARDAPQAVNPGGSAPGLALMPRVAHARLASPCGPS